MISSAGGAITLSDGSSATIPQGTWNQNENVTLSFSSDLPTQPPNQLFVGVGNTLTLTLSDPIPTSSLPAIDLSSTSTDLIFVINMKGNEGGLDGSAGAVEFSGPSVTTSTLGILALPGEYNSSTEQATIYVPPQIFQFGTTISVGMINTAGAKELSNINNINIVSMSAAFSNSTGIQQTTGTLVLDHSYSEKDLTSQVQFSVFGITSDGKRLGLTGLPELQYSMKDASIAKVFTSDSGDTALGGLRAGTTTFTISFRSNSISFPVVVKSSQSCPVAVISPAHSVWEMATSTTIIGTNFTLDGSGSHGNNGDAITYLWKISNKPDGSAATIVNPTASVASIRPDKSGDYSITLSVSDASLAQSKLNCGMSTSDDSMNLLAVGGASMQKSTVVASPTSVPADGKTNSLIKVSLVRDDGSPVANEPVTLWAAVDGTEVPWGSANPGVTDANGNYTFSANSTAAENVKFIIKDGITNFAPVLEQQPTVDFYAPPTATQGSVSNVQSGVSGTITFTEPPSDSTSNNLEFKVSSVYVTELTMTVINHTTGQSATVTLNVDQPATVLGYTMTITSIKQVIGKNSLGQAVSWNQATLAYKQQ
jgi:hypothetical protein